LQNILESEPRKILYIVQEAAYSTI
jgi:hypothetical protein